MKKVEKGKTFRYNGCSMIRKEKEAGNYGEKQEECEQAGRADIVV